MRTEPVKLYDIDDVVNSAIKNARPFLERGIEPMLNLNLKINNLTLDNIVCKINYKDSTIMFDGEQIAEKLGYDDVLEALDDVVSEYNKADEIMDYFDNGEPIEVTFVNKMGLYELVLHSDNKEAIPFDKWCNLVLNMPLDVYMEHESEDEDD